MASWRSFLGLPEKGEDYSYPLSGDSPELRALLAGVLTIGTDGLATVDEAKALGIPAFSRGVKLIAGTIAGLPLRTYGTGRVETSSIFDDPGAALGLDRFSWTETLLLHLVCYEEAFLNPIKNTAGAVVGYWPVHPGSVMKVERTPEGHKRFTVHYSDGNRVYGTPLSPTTEGELTHILGPSLDSLRGRPLWDSSRRLFQIALAAEQAATRTFTGALIRGLVTTAQDEDVDEDEALQLQEKLGARINGVENAGQMAFVNRHLDFHPWQSTNVDAQYHESRAFQIEEFARLLGMPPHLLAQTEKATSWGTGISEQNLGLARYTLMSYTSRIESALKPLNAPGVFQEFDYKGLLQGSPKDEIELLLAQTGAPILTVDEARAIQNRGPMPAGEPLRTIARPQEAPVNGN